MKKKILSATCALALLVNLVPLPAYAIDLPEGAGYTLVFDVTDANGDGWVDAGERVDVTVSIKDAGWATNEVKMPMTVIRVGFSFNNDLLELVTDNNIEEMPYAATLEDLLTQPNAMGYAFSDNAGDIGKGGVANANEAGEIIVLCDHALGSYVDLPDEKTPAFTYHFVAKEGVEGQPAFDIISESTTLTVGRVTSNPDDTKTLLDAYRLEYSSIPQVDTLAPTIQVEGAAPEEGTTYYYQPLTVSAVDNGSGLASLTLDGAPVEGTVTAGGTLTATDNRGNTATYALTVDAAAFNAAKDAAAALPETVTYADKEAVETARAALDAVTDLTAQAKLAAETEKVAAAAEAIAAIDTAIDAVEVKIGALPAVETLSVKDAPALSEIETALAELEAKNVPTEAISNYAVYTAAAEKLEAVMAEINTVKDLINALPAADEVGYGNYYITATVQITDGTTRQATYRVTVSEAAQQNAITIQNGEELEKALASATLLPGMFIYAEPGTYEGDFLVDMPVKLFPKNHVSITYNEDGSLQPRENGVVIKGSMTAIAEEVNVNGFDFVGTGTGTALTDSQIVQNCTFSNYETAVELEKNVHNSNSPTIWNNAFADNGTAVRFVTREWYTNLTGNTFWHNDVALEFAPACGIEGSYSATFDAVTTRGSMIRNRFYLQDGQLALANRSLNQATVNLTYNYFAQGNNTKPQAAMFEGPAVYSPYYETPGMDSITTDESLEDNVAEGTTTSVLTLTSGQGSSSTGTADSALQLSDSKFEELKNSETVTDLQINVQSTSNETDVVWNFAKEDLKEDYAGDSVNLGVAFTFTDFEYDTINEIVRKTQEEWGTESETLGSIAYQAMCFSHSGDLPGTATVKIRMNESLLDYYANHGNSMDDFKIYYFNEETGVLEKMERNIEVVQENGTYYMQFQIDHCSSYLVTPEDLLEDVSGFIEIILNAGNNGGYTLIDALLERVLPGSTVQEVLSHLSGGTMTVRDLQNNVVDETAAIGTGFTIGLGDGTTSPIQVVIGGDLTGNGSINADDLLQMRRAIIKYVTLDGVWLRAATTVSQGSTPGDQDLLQMRRVLLGLADSMYVN